MKIRHVSDVICRKCSRPGPNAGTVSVVVDEHGEVVTDRKPLDPVSVICKCGHETALFHGGDFAPVTMGVPREGQIVRIIPGA